MDFSHKKAIKTQDYLRKYATEKKWRRNEKAAFTIHIAKTNRNEGIWRMNVAAVMRYGVAVQLKTKNQSIE